MIPSSDVAFGQQMPETLLDGTVLVITGPPGSGKSTVAASFAETLQTAALLDGDAFFHSIRRGYIPPWKREASEQNTAVTRAIAAAADRLAAGGYAVIVDGIVGPWFLDTFLGEVTVPVHYAVIRPTCECVMGRAMQRKAPALVDPALLEKMYGDFADVGRFEHNVVDSTELTVDETVVALAELLQTGALCVSRDSRPRGLD